MLLSDAGADVSSGTCGCCVILMESLFPSDVGLSVEGQECPQTEWTLKGTEAWCGVFVFIKPRNDLVYLELHAVFLSL